MTVQFKDYYEVLGVDRSATPEQIRKAYRDLARKHHPDVSKAAGAEERFKEITEAYEVLKDPDKRQRYDQLGANWQHGQEFEPPPGFESFRFEFDGGEGFPGGFSDFFASLFGDQVRGFPGGFERGSRGGGFGGAGGSGGFAGFEGRGPSPRSRRGADVEAVLPLTVVELAHGGSRSVTLQDPRTGQTTTYDVKIPPGVTSGSKIRLSGQGGRGQQGAAAGDLFLKIEVQPDPRFWLDKSEKLDVRTRVDVAPWEAALGAKIDVPSPSGSVTLTVPPGSQSGQVLRLRGLGLPKSASTKGDLLVELRIVVPKALTDEERQLFEKLAAKSRFRPRGGAS